MGVPPIGDIVNIITGSSRGTRCTHCSVHPSQRHSEGLKEGKIRRWWHCVLCADIRAKAQDPLSPPALCATMVLAFAIPSFQYTSRRLWVFHLRAGRGSVTVFYSPLRFELEVKRREQRWASLREAPRRRKGLQRSFCS